MSDHKNKKRVGLPALGTARAVTAKTPRRVFTLEKKNKTPELPKNIEVSKKLFIPQTPSVTSHSTTPLINSEDFTSSSSAEPSVDLSQISSLLFRLPESNQNFLDDSIVMLTPILDRLLCIINNIPSNVIESSFNHEIIVELRNRLISYIDYDDFLTRVIICRILLGLTTGSNSSLYLPISQIFFKLSLDQDNIFYFEEENVDSILQKILINSTGESQIFAAASISQICESDQIRIRLIQNGIFENIHKFLTSFKTDLRLNTEILKITTNLIQEQSFLEKLIYSKTLSTASKNKTIFEQVVQLACKIPSFPSIEKLELVKIASALDFSHEDSITFLESCLPALSQGIEDTDDCGVIVLRLIRQAAEDGHSSLQTFLKIGKVCCQSKDNMEIYQEDDIFPAILNSFDFDTHDQIAAYSIVKMFNGFEQLKSQFQSLDSIET